MLSFKIRSPHTWWCRVYSWESLKSELCFMTQGEMLTVMLLGHGSRAGEWETGGGWCLCKSQVRTDTMRHHQTPDAMLWLVWNCKDDWSVSGYCRSRVMRWYQLSTWIPAWHHFGVIQDLTKWRYPEALPSKCTGCKSVNNNYCNKIADVKTYYHFM